MKLKKVCFSTQLSELYGRDGYQPHIKEGQEYWYFFPDDTEIFRETHEHWNKIRISYVRSGCLFYIFPEHPNVPEEFCPVSCIMASQFIMAELDPVKDLKDIMKDIDTDSAREMYCFDDKRTTVKNWPNEKEADINADDVPSKSELILLMHLN